MQCYELRGHLTSNVFDFICEDCFQTGTLRITNGPLLSQVQIRKPKVKGKMKLTGDFEQDQLINHGENSQQVFQEEGPSGVDAIRPGTN